MSPINYINSALTGTTKRRLIDHLEIKVSKGLGVTTCYAVTEDGEKLVFPITSVNHHFYGYGYTPSETEITLFGFRVDIEHVDE